MYKGLYNNFAHWYHGGSVYFYGDPHFDDADMMAIDKGRPTSEEQVKMINAKVGKNDTIIFLGDVGNKKWLKKVRGYKVLILGNHDAGATTYKNYVDEVYEGALTISDKIIISHEPIIGYPYAFNIHGHDHGNHYISENHMNTCAEIINYTPITLKSIIESGCLKNIPNIHRTAIDKQIERKNKKEGLK